ncbi:MerR family DNA-binding transcriptional regulator, partial [Parasutterella excrementihominis]
MLKTAEFAKMCHTTKDTLIFYDRIDVFKPAFVDSKKYRYYEVRQAVQFAFLSHL